MLHLSNGGMNRRRSSVGVRAPCLEYRHAAHTNPGCPGVYPAGMNRKLAIVGACLLVAGLAAFVVIRGGKGIHRSYRSDPPRDGFSLTVDLPKTNNTAPKAGGR